MWNAARCGFKNLVVFHDTQLIDITEGGILWSFKHKNTDTVQTCGSWRCVGDGWVSSVGSWVVWLLSEAAGSHNDFQRASCEGLARWSQDNSD